MSDDDLNQCPNGHASVGDGRCNIPDCAHCDPIVTKSTRNKDGLSMGGAAAHGVGRKRNR